jgi:hypothetical protein
MANYAIIEDNKVINVIVADSAEIAAEVTGKEVLETTGQPGIDWTRTDGVWLKPEEPEITLLEPEATTELETEVTE